MNDMSQVIVPKSDQINADDLIAGPITITVEAVQIKGGQEQPVSIFFTGSDKAFRPCKSMSRVLVAAWGPDANAYVGRSMTLYRDPEVKWGGMAVGGIRISHLSHIERDMVMALTATKGSRKPYQVKPLKAQVQQIAPRTDKEQDDLYARTDAWATKYVAALQDAVTEAELVGIRQRQAEKLAWVRDNYPTLYQRVIEADPASALPDRPATAEQQPGDAVDPANQSSQQAELDQPAMAND